MARTAPKPAPRPPPAITLEALLTAPAGFGLTTASPLQRAVCRIIDGLPLGELANVPEVRAALIDVDSLPVTRPTEVLILSGIRTAKSLTAAATAVRASQTCDMSGLGPGETPRVSVVSTALDQAKVVFDHIVGNVLARPALRALMIGESTSDSITLRHPSGRPVEIKVVAGARAGSTLIARWSAGVIFDEAPRMIGQGDGVVNYDDCRAAVVGRLLPGAQVISIGSPWAPFGPIYERVIERWGKPGADLVIVRAPAHHMNPVHWTPERVEKLRTQDPGVYRTDVLAEFSDPESSLFSSADLDKVTRPDPAELPREEGHSYAAAMDPATRGNAWTLVITTRKRVAETGRTRQVVVLARQWIGSKLAPLSADAVLREIADICRGYNVHDVRTDQFAADPLRDIARRYGLNVFEKTITQAVKVELFESMRTKLTEGDVELPPDPVLRSDLLSVRKRVTQSGITIELPRTSDGRHADYAPALALLLGEWVSEPKFPKVGPEPGTPAWFAEKAAKEKADAMKAAARRDKRRGLSWFMNEAMQRKLSA